MKKNNSNKYTLVYFLNKNKVGFMKYVHNIQDCHRYFSKNNVLWDECNVYNRRTKEFMYKIKN